MRTSGGGPGKDGPYYVYVLNTGVVGFHQTPDRRLNQIRRKDGDEVNIVWVSKPFPDREDAEQYCARLTYKRDSEPPVFLRICRCEYARTDTADLLIPKPVWSENPYTADLATGALSLNGAAGC